jgi:uncharacterized damage-inducible protein DinB
MLTANALIDLFRHMEWADAAVWRSVFAFEPAKTDSKLKDSLYHLHVAHYAYLRVWHGEPADAPHPTFDDSTAIAPWGRAYYKEAFTKLESKSDESVSEPMAIPWANMVEQVIGRAPEKTTFGEVALHVAMHSQYHRGQINHRLRQIGGEPPVVDYITWIWIGRPAAEWPEV